ncbi:MAG: RecQ family ATP-dependent DNA helicase [Tidjanibacter sp.]|nr:RecQ family ATP-dependent DNA helicase [Tidjanibacter sp.]
MSDNQTNNPQPTPSEEVLATLRKYWGYDSLRPGQAEVISSVLARRDTLALMPTGAGKSLLYQLPTLMMEGLCIVVTPLVALMKDQTEGLRRRHINAVALHGGQSERHIEMALDNCVYGDVKFLFISPERIASHLFAARMRLMRVALIAVDEAHCISQWGYDFRPSYLNIKALREAHPEAPCLALTASATERVAEDIMHHLRFEEPNILRSDFSRPNLSFVVRRTENRREQLLHIIGSVGGSGIVYARTREMVVQLAEWLRSEGVEAIHYHAGLSPMERSLHQDDWVRGKVRVMVATNAFGMGIDKADVRFVIHYDTPSSPESYYQEAGRAGRDGKRSYAVLLTEGDEESGAMRRLSSEFPENDYIKEVYTKLCNYLQVGYGEGEMQTFVLNFEEFTSRYKLFRPTAWNALKILQQNGYLALTDEGENPARVMFSVSRDDLYAVRIERRELDTVLRTLMRLYTGIFTNLRSIDIQDIALHSGFTEEMVREQLKQLWRMHVIRYVPKNYSPLVMLTGPREQEKDLFINPTSTVRRREMAMERLEGMMRYVNNTDECRSRLLLNYFGQTDAVDCGVCDICLAKRKSAAKEAEKMAEQKSVIIEN